MDSEHTDNWVNTFGYIKILQKWPWFFIVSSMVGMDFYHGLWFEDTAVERHNFQGKNKTSEFFLIKKYMFTYLCIFPCLWISHSCAACHKKSNVAIWLQYTLDYLWVDYPLCGLTTELLEPPWLLVTVSCNEGVAHFICLSNISAVLYSDLH
jgi:hypothetical protein